MTATNARISRDAETREQDMRSTSDDWRPPELLPTPDADPDYGYRWIRKSLLGELDHNNMGMKRREGYEFCTPEMLPELALEAGISATESGHFEVGGLILARMPHRKARQRDAFYQAKAQAQETGLSSQLLSDAGVDHRMPVFQERKSKTTFGSSSE